MVISAIPEPFRALEVPKTRFIIKCELSFIIHKNAPDWVTPHGGGEVIPGRKSKGCHALRTSISQKTMVCYPIIGNRLDLQPSLIDIPFKVDDLVRCSLAHVNSSPCLLSGILFRSFRNQKIKDHMVPRASITMTNTITPKVSYII